MMPHVAIILFCFLMSVRELSELTISLLEYAFFNFLRRSECEIFWLDTTVTGTLSFFAKLEVAWSCGTAMTAPVSVSHEGVVCLCI